MVARDGIEQHYITLPLTAILLNPTLSSPAHFRSQDSTPPQNLPWEFFERLNGILSGSPVLARYESRGTVL